MILRIELLNSSEKKLILKVNFKIQKMLQMYLVVSHTLLKQSALLSYIRHLPGSSAYQYATVPFSWFSRGSELAGHDLKPSKNYSTKRFIKIVSYIQ